MMRWVTTAAATLSLTGPLALQGVKAANALRWWAAETGVDMSIEDDTGSPAAAAQAYGRWLHDDVDILLGPYGSNLVRRVGPLVASTGRVLWNHGGSADDLSRPLVASLPARASTYFHEAVEMAARSGPERILLIVGRGRFATAVASGARAAAAHHGLSVSEMRLGPSAGTTIASGDAVLVVGTFEEEAAFLSGLPLRPRLIACVAAGLPEFGTRLGVAAEGVLGPVQWLPDDLDPEVGPSGAAFARGYASTCGRAPGYVAAQAAAAGFLALAVGRRRMSPEDLRTWRTSTLLGPFALDGSWRQVGHRARTVRWHDGRQVPFR